MHKFGWRNLKLSASAKLSYYSDGCQSTFAHFWQDVDDARDVFGRSAVQSEAPIGDPVNDMRRRYLVQNPLPPAVCLDKHEPLT